MPVITRSQSEKVVASNAIVIDNCVVSKLTEEGRYGICIHSIKLAKKLNPALDIDSLPKIAYGSRGKDNRVITQLAAGTMSFEDVIRQI
jgi:hypothetical protein